MYDKDFSRQFNRYNLKRELYGSNPPLNRYQFILSNNDIQYSAINNINNNNNINNSINNNNYIASINQREHLYSNNVSIEQNLNDNLVSKIGLDSIIPYDNTKCPFWISWSPDNSYLALSTNDSVDIFEPNSGEMLYNIKDHKQVVSMVLWFNEGHGEVENFNSYGNSNNKVIKLKNQFNEGYKVSNEIKSKTSKSKYKNSLTSPYTSFLSCSLDHSINVYRNFELVASLVEHDDWLKSLALSSDSKVLLSGCASSTICGWDLLNGVVKFRIEKAHPATDGSGNLNTINSLKFSNFNNNLFISGSRYGTMRMWDIREKFTSPIFSVQAHNKLNILHFTRDDRHILTSGRDNTMRLWDTRVLTSSPSTKVVGIGNNYSNPDKINSGHSSNYTNIGIIREYNKHRCVGYNIGCSFINNERQIISGSEDQQVYIYDTESGNVIKKIASHRSPVHLVPVSNGNSEMRVATSSIDACDIHIYSPQLIESDEKLTYANKYLGINAPKEEDVFPQIKIATYLQRATMESLMLKFGDSLFQFYHKNNISPTETSNNDEFTSLNKKIEKEFKTTLFIEARRIARKLNLTDRELVLLIARNSVIDDPSFFDKTIDDENVQRDGTIDEKEFGPLVQHLTSLNAGGSSIIFGDEEDEELEEEEEEEELQELDLTVDSDSDNDDDDDDDDNDDQLGVDARKILKELEKSTNDDNNSDSNSSGYGTQYSTDSQEYFSDLGDEDTQGGRNFKFNFNFSDKSDDSK